MHLRLNICVSVHRLVGIVHEQEFELEQKKIQPLAVENSTLKAVTLNKDEK